MNHATFALARRVVRTAMKLGCFIFGTWLAAVLPVEMWADARRADNLAAGHVPNMDPGTVDALAAFVAIAPLLAVILIEGVRCWAMGSKPLTLPACVALGLLAAWPVGAAFTVAWLHFGYSGLFIESCFGILAFYSIRRAWLVTRERHYRAGLVQR